MRIKRKTRNTTTYLKKLLLIILTFIAFLASVIYLYRKFLISTKPIPLKHRLWSGEPVRVRPRKNAIGSTNININTKGSQIIEIAVAYCNNHLGWLARAIQNELPKESELRITILSKCGNAADIPSFRHISNIKDVELIELPNKGGCDLAFAHFIKHYMERKNVEAAAANSILVFLKDTPRTPKNCHQRGHYRSFHEMLHISSRGEFICGVKLLCKMSPFHDTHTLKQFSKKSYKRHGDSSLSSNNFNAANYKDLNDFINREFNWTFSNEKVTEVCYGGSFAVPASNLFVDDRLKAVFTRLEQILTEGPSMSVVEHFSERLWASWLATPLNKRETESIISLRRSIITENGRYIGTLGSDMVDTC